jgi:predicted MPP superfamily phosphohydrolase
LALYAALALGLIAAVDGFAIEPYWIEVTHHVVRAPVAAPLRIAHLTDLHTTGVGRREESMLALVEAEHPDLIVVTGDCVTDPIDYEGVGAVLSRLSAPLGVWVVRGNWEVARPIRDENAFFTGAGAHYLKNAAARARDDVWVVGLDDLLAGRPDPDRAFKDVPPGAFSIALFHSPALFDAIAGRCTLAFAGHTHGGQVCVPGFGAPYLPGGCGPYLAGWYELNGSRMYVSRGVGCTAIQVRFWCRPEIAIYDVEPTL